MKYRFKMVHYNLKNCKNKARESCRILEELLVGGHDDGKLNISEQPEEK